MPNLGDSIDMNQDFLLPFSLLRNCSDQLEEFSVGMEFETVGSPIYTCEICLRDGAASDSQESMHFFRGKGKSLADAVKQAIAIINEPVSQLSE